MKLGRYRCISKMTTEREWGATSVMGNFAQVLPGGGTLYVDIEIPADFPLGGFIVIEMEESKNGTAAE